MKNRLLLKIFFATMALLAPNLARATVSTTSNSVTYTCNGTQTTWSYTFPVILASDIQVWMGPPLNLVQQSSNFSVNTTTSVVTFPITGSACPTGDQLELLRVEPLTQLVALSNQGPIPVLSLEKAYDKLTMITQQIQTQLNQTQVFPSSLTGAFLTWNSAGQLQNTILQALDSTSSPTFAGITIGSLNGIGKYSAGVLGTALADTDYTTPNGTETFTNKTFDTGGTGNVFKVGGVTYAPTGVSGNSGIIAQSKGSLVTGDCVKIDANGNFIDNGSGCSGGSGATYPATSGIVTTNASAWTTSISGTASQFVMGNATLKSLINSANLNWTDINSIKNITAINWTDSALLNAVQSKNINWTNVSGAIGNKALNWTDFPASGIMKFNGSSAPVAAASGTDYAPATSGSNILYGDGSGGFGNVTIGTGLVFTGGTLSTGVSSPVSKSVNTIYQATTDGDLLVNAILTVINSGDNPEYLISTDSSSSPTTVQGQNLVSAGQNGTYEYGLSTTVKILKGNYYKVTFSGNVSQFFITFTPS